MVFAIAVKQVAAVAFGGHDRREFAKGFERGDFLLGYRFPNG
jgi:hypothetical protein